MTLHSLDTLISRINDRPVALLNLARSLLAGGHGEPSRELCARALALAGDDPQVAALAAEISSHGVPQWHFNIVRDQVRNDAYDAALRRALRPGMRVLEIGTGSGLLAMMAARAGAAQVLTCEMDPAVAAAARKVIAHNGYADRVKVIGKHSADLDVEQDLGGPVDLMVSEIVSNDMLGEAALPAHEQAVRRLLKPGAQVIPARGAVRVALAEDGKQPNRAMGTVSGFDLSPFNHLLPRRHQLAVGDERVQLRSAAADVAVFDFASGGPYPEQETRTTVTVEADGANGVVQWIALDMDDEGRYENAPVAGSSSCWALQFYPFPPAFRPVAGERITIVCSHDRHTLRIWATRACAPD